MTFTFDRTIWAARDNVSGATVKYTGIPTGVEGVFSYRLEINGLSIDFGVAVRGKKVKLTAKGEQIEAVRPVRAFIMENDFKIGLGFALKKAGLSLSNEGERASIINAAVDGLLALKKGANPELSAEYSVEITDSLDNIPK